MAMALVSAAILFLWPGSPFALTRLHRERSLLPLYLIGPAVVLYMVTGIGLIARTRWGDALLKFSLYLLYLVFPVDDACFLGCLEKPSCPRSKTPSGADNANPDTDVSDGDPGMLFETVTWVGTGLKQPVG